MKKRYQYPDPSKLAQMILDWESAIRKTADLEAQIQEAVLERGSSLVVGNVRATYYRGRKTYDYEFAAEDADPAVVKKHTKTETTTKIDWRSICKEEEIEDIPYVQAAPSVSLKIQ